MFGKLSKLSIFNTVLSLLLIYFIFHLIYGNRGGISYFKLQAEIQNAYNELDALRAERVELENKTKLLRPESLDKDLLDEKARSLLGLSKPNEKVFRPE